MSANAQVSGAGIWHARHPLAWMFGTSMEAGVAAASKVTIATELVVQI